MVFAKHQHGLATRAHVFPFWMGNTSIVMFNIVMVFAIHQHELATGIHVPPHPESPCHLPPRSTPPGCPRALALGALIHASNLHWPSILQMVMDMFQCYFLKSSHPRLLLLNPKVRCLHLCLLCCSHHSKILYDPPPRVMEIK